MTYPSALQTNLPSARSRDVGTLIMRAARDVLMRRDVDASRAALMLDSDCSAERIKQTLADACYRYCAHLDGAHVVLTGPGRIQHLKANARSIAGSRFEPHIEAALLKWFENRRCSQSSSLPTICVAVADGIQDTHVQHHWIHDALLFKSHSSSVCTGLVGIPMTDIKLSSL